MAANTAVMNSNQTQKQTQTNKQQSIPSVGDALQASLSALTHEDLYDEVILNLRSVGAIPYLLPAIAEEEEECEIHDCTFRASLQTLHNSHETLFYTGSEETLYESDSDIKALEDNAFYIEPQSYLESTYIKSQINNSRYEKKKSIKRRLVRHPVTERPASFHQGPSEKDVLIKALRDYKYFKIYPQGLFNFSHTLSGDTLQTVSELVDKVSNLKGSLDVNLAVPTMEVWLRQFEYILSDPMDRYVFCILLLLLLREIKKSVAGNKLLSTLVTCISLYVSYKALVSGHSFIQDILTAALDDEDDVFYDMPRPQMGDVSGMAVNAILSLVYFRLFGKSIEKEDYLVFLKGTGDLPKMKEGLKFTADFFLSVLQLAIDYYNKWSPYKIPGVVTSMCPEATEFLESVVAMITEFQNGAACNAENGGRVFELQQKGFRVLGQIPNTREFADYKNQVQIALGQLKPLVAKLERSNIVGNGPRSEPLGIMIGGPTGVGKSTMTTIFLLELMARILPEERLPAFEKNHNDFIYNRVSENHFWDGDHGQFCMLLDDLGQSVDVAGDPANPYFESIRGINTANYQLTMAHLEEKGNVNFQHQLCFATTNRRAFNLNSVVSSEAFVRRWRVAYLQVPKPEFCKSGTDSGDLWNRRLDEDKIPVMGDMSIHEFYPWDFSRGCHTGGPISYTELLELCVSKFKKLKSYGKTMMDIHQDVKKRALADRISTQGYWSKATGAIYDISETTYAELSRTCGLSIQALKEYFSKESVADKVSGIDDVKEAVSSLRMRDIFSLESFQSYLEEVKKRKNTLISAASVMAAAYGIRHFFTHIKSSDLCGQSVPNLKSKKVDRKSRNRVRGLRPLVKSPNDPQSMFNPATISFAEKVLTRNTYVLYVKGIKLGNIIFVKGRTCVMPMHYVHAIEEMDDPVITFVKVGSPSISIEVRMDDIEFFSPFESEDEDCVFAVMPKVFHAHPDISESFIRHSELDKFSFPQVVLGMSTDKHGHLLINAKPVFEGTMSYTDYKNSSVISYDIPTRKGDCGSPLFAASKTINEPRILGFHTAGDNRTRGFSIVLEYEAVKTVLDSLATQDIIVPLDGTTGVPQLAPQFNSIDKGERLRTPVKSRIVPSPLHGAWGPSNCIPAKLTPFVNNEGEHKDVWAIARSKYSTGSKAVNVDLLSAVTQEYASSLYSASRKDEPWAPRVFSKEEAVAGVPGVDFCEALPRNTSSGYPYCLSVRQKGKKDFFGDEDVFDFSSEKCESLFAEVDEYIQIAKKGVRIPGVFADYLKDERRPFEKVMMGKTRLISAMNVKYAILFRMYFLDFVRFVMNNRIDNGMCIGINPYSAEWGSLYRRMTTFGKNTCFAGDFSNYDGSITPAMQYAGLSVIEQYYHNASDEDRLVRSALFEEVVNSRHISGNVIYEWFGSVPSGVFLTTPLNCIVNNVMLRYCAVACLLREHNIDPLFAKPSDYVQHVSDIHKHMRICTFGDDNGVNVHEDWTVVNQVTMSREFASVGMTYTDEAKSSKLVEFKSWDDCSFLKRGFSFDDKTKMYLAPLALDVILEAPYWTKNNMNEESFKIACSSMIGELALHDEATFEKWSPVMLRAMQEKCGFVFPITRQKELRAKMANSEFLY